jgi:hypothetical protein
MYAVEWLSFSPTSSPLQTDDDGNFRTNSGLFYTPPSGSNGLRNGVATYASAWPMQGHPVSVC